MAGKFRQQVSRRAQRLKKEHKVSMAVHKGQLTEKRRQELLKKISEKYPGIKTRKVRSS